MEITIKKETLAYVLNTLDCQLQHTKHYKSRSKAAEKQLAYYQGMHTMLNIIIQQAFTDDSLILWGETKNSFYQHTIKRKEEIV